MEAEAWHGEGKGEFDGENGKAFAAEISVAPEKTPQQEDHAHHRCHREKVTEGDDYDVDETRPSGQQCVLK